MKAACTGMPAWRRLRIQPTTVDPVVQISSITMTKGDRDKDCEEDPEDGDDGDDDDNDKDGEHNACVSNRNCS